VLKDGKRVIFHTFEGNLTAEDAKMDATMTRMSPSRRRILTGEE
jgi:hypothetical protein